MDDCSIASDGISWYKNPVPKPPVPDLNHTLQRYLEYARVVANNDQMAILRTENAVDEFKKVAIGLQERLEQIAEVEDNWINLFWLPEMYLKFRTPLPVNINPVYNFPQQTFKNLDEQLDFSSWMVRGFCDFKDLIDKKLIEREKSTGSNKILLCMDQYDRMMRCYREANPKIDIQHFRPMVCTESTNWNEHILVMCRNQAFIVFTRLNGCLLPAKEIKAQLEKVVKMSDEYLSTNDQSPATIIGGGNVGDRDECAEFWRIMKQSNINKESLHWIQTASFALCIDLKPNGFGTGTRPVTSVNRCNRLLHGFGSKCFGLNRWYEVTLQLIVADDGTNGLCIEHSVIEGIVLIKLVEYALQFVKRNTSNKNWGVAAQQVKPLQLQWEMTTEALTNLEKQVITFDKTANDLDLRLLTFEDFGREFIKSCRISPDGFVQLAMQLAIYKLFNHLVSTYESASIRRFRNGRVDNIRAATPEAYNWVKAMHDPAKHTNEKRQLFEEAVKKQAEITLENISGYGIDNHLCALNVLSSEGVQEGRLNEMPEIFSDPIWKETMRFPLSTSQVTAATEDTYLCYGAVVDDGYGCSYNIKPYSIIFAPTSFRSCRLTNSKKFENALVESLRDIKSLITE